MIILLDIKGTMNQQWGNNKVVFSVGYYLLINNISNINPK